MPVTSEGRFYSAHITVTRRLKGLLMALSASCNGSNAELLEREVATLICHSSLLKAVMLAEDRFVESQISNLYTVLAVAHN